MSPSEVSNEILGREKPKSFEEIGIPQFPGTDVSQDQNYCRNRSSCYQRRQL
jgi:hypothetical protein